MTETAKFTSYVRAVLDEVQDVITVKKVFGEPYEQNGLTLIPAAAVRGGGGGGGGSEGSDGGEGGGGGFGVTARPIGAYVVRDGRASWEPAIDVTRIVIGFQIATVAVMWMLTRRRRRRRAR